MRITIEINKNENFSSQFFQLKFSFSIIVRKINDVHETKKK